MNNECLIESLSRYIGQTVTIFVASGGISGSGFTGVLACVENDCIKLINSVGAAPACPVGSSCTGSYNSYYGNNYGANNFLGCVSEIPICRIVSFTHNAI